MFNISKVIGRKKWPSFLTHNVFCVYLDELLLVIGSDFVGVLIEV